jgi:asparagine synthase (glutamine-hydrolysing)
MKYIFKEALRDFLPEAILRRGKMGFGLPIGEWFRTTLSGYLKETLLSERAVNRGYFKPRTLEALINEHVSGRAEHGYRLWALLVLEIWHRLFIEKEKL